MMSLTGPAHPSLVDPSRPTAAPRGRTHPSPACPAMPKSILGASQYSLASPTTASPARPTNLSTPRILLHLSLSVLSHHVSVSSITSPGASVGINQHFSARFSTPSLFPRPPNDMFTNKSQHKINTSAFFSMPQHALTHLSTPSHGSARLGAVKNRRTFCRDFFM